MKAMQFKVLLGVLAGFALNGKLLVQLRDKEAMTGPVKAEGRSGQ